MLRRGRRPEVLPPPVKSSGTSRHRHMRQSGESRTEICGSEANATPERFIMTTTSLLQVVAREKHAAQHGCKPRIEDLGRHHARPVSALPSARQ